VLTLRPAEEIRDASRVLPLAMMWTLIINGTTGFIMVVTFAFCIPDQLISGVPNYGFTYIDVFYNSTGSTAAASVMTALITLLCFCSTISAAATSSRQMFAFARDRGLPFSSFLCRVSRPFDHATATPTHGCLGPPGLGNPLQRCLRLLRHHMPPLPHQPRLRGRIQRHRLPYCRCHPQLIHHLNLLRGAPQDTQRPPAPPRTLESWEGWIADEYYRSVVPARGLCVHVFPDRQSSYPVSICHVRLRSVLLADTCLLRSYMNWSSPMYAGTVTFAVVYFFVYGRKVYSGPVVLVKEEH